MAQPTKYSGGTDRAECKSYRALLRFFFTARVGIL